MIIQRCMQIWSLLCDDLECAEASITDQSIITDFLFRCYRALRPPSADILLCDLIAQDLKLFCNVEAVATFSSWSQAVLKIAKLFCLVGFIEEQSDFLEGLSQQLTEMPVEELNSGMKRQWFEFPTYDVLTSAFHHYYCRQHSYR